MVAVGLCILRLMSLLDNVEELRVCVWNRSFYPSISSTSSSVSVLILHLREEPTTLYLVIGSTSYNTTRISETQIYYCLLQSIPGTP